MQSYARHYFLLVLGFYCALLCVAASVSGQDANAFFRVDKVYQRGQQEYVVLQPMVSPTVVTELQESTDIPHDKDLVSCVPTVGSTNFTDHKDNFILLDCGKQKLKVAAIYFNPTN